MELCEIQERKLRVRDSMEIEGPDGERLAMVKKSMVTPLRERWIAEMGDGTELRVQGNSLDHEYELEHEGAKIAQVPRRWFRVRDTCGIEVAPGQQGILVLAVTVAVDALAGGRKRFDYGPSACCSSPGGSP